jgi:hypothetical protein
MRSPKKGILKVLLLLLFAVAVLVCANLNIKIEWPAPALPDEDDPAVATGPPAILNGLRFRLIAPKRIAIGKSDEQPSTKIQLRIDNTTSKTCQVYLHGRYMRFAMRDAFGNDAFHDACAWQIHELRNSPEVCLRPNESRIIRFGWALAVSTGTDDPAGPLRDPLKGTLRFVCRDELNPNQFWKNQGLSKGQWQLRLVYNKPNPNLDADELPFASVASPGPYWTGAVEVTTDIFIDAQGVMKA